MISYRNHRPQIRGQAVGDFSLEAGRGYKNSVRALGNLGRQSESDRGDGS